MSAGIDSTVRRSPSRSEEHTSELQSRQYLVCRLLLEKKKITMSSSRSSSFATFRHQLTILSKTDELAEEQRHNSLGPVVTDWYSSVSDSCNGPASLVD